LDIRNRLLKKVNEDSENKKRGRKDTKMPNVMISDRRIKTAAKYKISEIPHPFTTREEYERSLQMPLGGETYCGIFSSMLSTCLQPFSTPLFPSLLFPAVFFLIYSTPLSSTLLLPSFAAEWNASNVVKATSVPDILLRAGRIVQPIAMSKAQTNAAKKEKPPPDDVDKKKMNRTIKANKKHKK
jgi:Utp14 protein